MFTGIIRATAKIKKVEKKNKSLVIIIEKPRGWKVELGDSLATDGVCLTATKVTKDTLTCELIPETLNKTYFGRQIPKFVNLEQSLRFFDTLGGHLILGHVDAVGRVTKITSVGHSQIYQIRFPAKFSKLVVPKGAIAIDGISLTVVDVGKNWFVVALVDYTIRHTTLGKKKVDDLVNIEFDIIAKYLSKLLTHLKHGPRSSKGTI